MPENKTEKTTPTNEEKELKTLEDIDGTKDTKSETNEVANEDSTNKLEDYMKQVDQLKQERDSYKAKYEKAIEVNNSLYQRLTSPKPVTEKAIDTILKLF